MSTNVAMRAVELANLSAVQSAQLVMGVRGAGGEDRAPIRPSAAVSA